MMTVEAGVSSQTQKQKQERLDGHSDVDVEISSYLDCHKLS